MIDKNTETLQQELMDGADIDDYIKGNSGVFRSRTIPELLNELFLRQSISKAEVARKAEMSEVYLHQVFAGRRTPSRDRLICMCIGLNATLDDTQRLLKEASYAQLYPKAKRDAIIIHGILHGTPLYEINEKLYDEQEKTLL